MKIVFDPNMRTIRVGDFVYSADLLAGGYETPEGKVARIKKTAPDAGGLRMLTFTLEDDCRQADDGDLGLLIQAVCGLCDALKRLEGAVFQHADVRLSMDCKDKRVASENILERLSHRRALRGRP